MTKPRFDFAKENRGIARRALWVLRGNPSSREVPDDFSAQDLWHCVGDDGYPKPLAAFGLRRYLDAMQDDPNATTDEPFQSYVKALRLERDIDKTVRRVAGMLRGSAEEWDRAVELRKHTDHLFAWVESDPSTEQIGARLAEVSERLDLVGREIEQHRRELRGHPVVNSKFPSLCGLPQEQRVPELDAQVLRLVDAGVEIEAIAFVMGWDDAPPDQVRERIRKRLKAARDRELAGPEK